MSIPKLPAHLTGEGWRLMEIICLHDWIAPVIQERDSLKTEVERLKKIAKQFPAAALSCVGGV